MHGRSGCADCPFTSAGSATRRARTTAAVTVSARIRYRMTLTYTMSRLTMSTANEYAFEMAVSSVRFGVGVTREVGMDLADLGARRVMVITDPVVGRLAPARTVMESLEANRVPAVLCDHLCVAPPAGTVLCSSPLPVH